MHGEGSDEAGATESARWGAFGRLARMFAAPQDIFQDIVRRPTWVVAMILIALVASAGQVVVVSRVDFAAGIERQLESSPHASQMSESDKRAAIELGERFRYVPAVGSIVGVPLVLALIAALFLLGLRLAGSDVGYESILSSTVHAMWPASVVGTIAAVVTALQRTRIELEEAEYLVRSNLGAFLPPDVHPALRSVAGSLDVFSLWSIVLLVMGLAAVGRVGRGASAAIVLTLWGLYVLGKAGLAAAFPTA